MSRIFISHSSANNLQAAAVGAWLGSRFEELAKMVCRDYLNGASEPSLEELRLVGFENEFETPPDLCAEFR